MNQRIGFIGKASITRSEARKLTLMGRYIARTGRTLVYVPAQGSAEAIVSGVQGEGGVTEAIRSGVIGASDHTFVYADARLFTRLQEAMPDIVDSRAVTLIFSELELDIWLRSIRAVFESQGITPPVDK